MEHGHEHYMALAIEEARRSGAGGNRAVGAVIVRDGVIVGAGGNQRESATDPTGHAEVTAMRAAATVVGLDFIGTTLYTTLEPCPMCAGAIAVCGIPTVVVGELHGGDRRWGAYSVDKVLDLVGFGTRLEAGVLAAECAAVLAEFDHKQGRRR